MSKTKKPTTPKRFAYALMPLEMADPTFTKISPIIVVEGERGYHRTDYSWTKVHAEAARDQLNTRLGLTKTEAELLFTRSMFPGAVQAVARHSR